MAILLLILTLLYWFFVIFIILSAIFFLAIQLTKEKIRPPSEPPKGRVLVMIPCKGLDLTLGETLSSIKQQEYDGFTPLCIVDDINDPAVTVIKNSGLKMIISDEKCKGCSGKVRALCSAIKQFPYFDYYVIADSDIIARKNWLNSLMTELSDRSVGLSTTFPIFVPNGRFWSHVKAVWGMVGLSMMKSNRTRFGWGGSLAFSRSLVDGYTDVFCSSISDDIALSKICKKRGQTLSFNAEAIPLIHVDENRKTFMEWANRQVALSVSSGGSVLSFGLVYFLGQCVLMISSLILGYFVSHFFFLLLLPFFTQSLRYRKAHGNLPAGVVLIEFILPFIYSYNLLHAAKVKDIEWRGGKYTLHTFHDL